MALQVRGHHIASTFAFIEAYYDASARRQIAEKLSAEVRRGLASMRPEEWYPRAYQVEIMSAIASVAPEENTACAALVACGRFVAQKTQNAQTRLLMGILTPSLFLKKIQSFWQRDQRGGRFEVDLSEAEKGRVEMRLTDVKEYNHIALTELGAIKVALDELCRTAVHVAQAGWTLAEPGPKEINYEVTWS